MTEEPLGKWLLIGGAGYIGSHTAWELELVGGQAVVLDDLSTGIADRLPPTATFVQGNAADCNLVAELISDHRPSGIMHFAARKQARESVREPLKYWVDNLMPLLGTVQAVANFPIPNFIFSSSCSVYGAVDGATEETPLSPMSPYARSKMVSEMIVRDVLDASTVNWCALRYFNVIGNGDFPHAIDTSEECVVPAVTQKILSRKPPVIFGTSFRSKDGSALRDYVDVRDLAAAHIATARWMTNFGELPNPIINVGSGEPRSVLEIVHLLADLLDWRGGYNVQAPEAGDPGPVFAIPSEFLANIGWSPRRSLRQSLESHCRNL